MKHSAPILSIDLQLIASCRSEKTLSVLGPSTRVRCRGGPRRSYDQES